MLAAILLGLSLVLLAAFFVLRSRNESARRAAALTLARAAAQTEAEAAAAAAAEASGPKLLFFFGSQTGTAEQFATDLADEGERHGFSASAVDLEDFEPGDLRETSLAVFLVATYGEGDPTDNAIEFTKWLKDKDGELEDGCLGATHFSVFGLGNRQYESYNSMGKLLQRRLGALGGTCVYEYGEGDDDANLEEDFESWKDGLYGALRRHAFPGEAEEDAAAAGGGGAEPPAPTYRLSAIEVPAPAAGKRRPKPKSRSRAGSAAGKLSLAAQGYFAAEQVTLCASRQLRQRPSRSDKDLALGSTVHVELALKGSGLSYSTADNLAVCPEGDAAQVAAVAELFALDLAQWVVVNNEGGEGGPPFPSPCTVREALGRFCDLNAVPSRSLLGKVAHLAHAPEHRAKLFHLASKEGKAEYAAFVTAPQRSLVEVLGAFPSMAPLADFGHLVEVLPRLQPRYYTIASSSAVHPGSVHLTVSVVRERKPAADADADADADAAADDDAAAAAPTTPRFFDGVCSTFLGQLAVGDKAWVFVRPSTFVMPPAPTTPIVMVGPGTGIAPMRALIQERQQQRRDGLEAGPAVLFFGCRRSEEDFIYEDELLAACGDGTLTALHTAFSRQTPGEKVYVQHQLKEQGAAVWDLMRGRGGHFYVCGGIAMGNDVMAAFEDMVRAHAPELDAKEYVKELQEQGRYVQELWS